MKELSKIRKHPRYKYYYLAKLNIKWQVFRYNKLVKLFWSLRRSRFEFIHDLSYRNIFKDVWENKNTEW